MAWETAKLSADETVIREVKDNFSQCVDWEAQTRVWFDYDNKFAEGDSRNMYQWDDWVVSDRITSNRPCLTINKTRQHNLLIINDAKQNKPGVNIRPVGDEASYDGAQIFQDMVRHIEYISNAESVYDSATEYQVKGGFGYWRVCTDYLPKSFDQEIYIKRVKDPRSVYLDPFINEVDGSDARYGFIFEDMPQDLYKKTYPKFQDVGGSYLFSGTTDDWYNLKTVRVCEYYRKIDKEKTLCSFEDINTRQRITKYVNELTDDEKQTYDNLKKIDKDLPDEAKMVKERKELDPTIEWYKIAGNTIIDRGIWAGKYIPIVRLIGSETVIDGVLDRKGHTRALLDAQRMYNINTSANVEFGALQTKIPWLAPMAAVEGLEEYWKTANTVNHAWLPWNHLDEDGKEIPPPVRPPAPQSSPAYVQQMQIAQSEMMMVSGQYQAQMGENENAKSGIAINARQRQGDRSTYHFIDNLAIAVRFTGKILIDLIPKIYDTPRVMRISTADGTIQEVTVDVTAPDAVAEAPAEEMDKSRKMAQIIFNPSVGMYDVQSETGPSFATKRQEAFNALTQIAVSQKDFMHMAGDQYFKMADFPGADVLAERYRRAIPPNLLGEAPDPKTEEAMNLASEHIQQLTAQLQEAERQLKDKTTELEIKRDDLGMRSADRMLDNLRADYRALDDRIKSLGNSGPAISVEQIQPLIKQVIAEALRAGGPSGEAEHLPGLGEGGTPIASVASPNEQETASVEGGEPAEGTAPVDGARKAPDGKWYLPDPSRQGKYLQVMENA